MKAKPIIISSKGQIALPKDIVSYLGSKLLKLERLNEHEVKIVPIRDAGGRLSEYAQNADIDDFQEIRNKSWNAEMNHKFRNTHG